MAGEEEEEKWWQQALAVANELLAVADVSTEYEAD